MGPFKWAALAAVTGGGAVLLAAALLALAAKVTELAIDKAIGG